MKYITYQHNGNVRPGVLVGETVYSLAELGFSAATLEEFICTAPIDIHSRIRGAVTGCVGTALADVRLLAPIPEPRQEIIIMQNNYAYDASTAQELRGKAQAGQLLPTYYYKKASWASTDGGTVPRYEGFLSQLDMQVELCAVLGASVTACPFAEVHSHIFGYLVINNVIAHDVTVRHRRPYISTGLDGFLPMSPWIVSADEFSADHVFRLRSYVNGKLVQNAVTDLRVFTPEYAIADLSQASELCGASILSTGTPVGTLKDQGLPFLQSGDIVCCEVDGVGSVTSTVR